MRLAVINLAGSDHQSSIQSPSLPPSLPPSPPLLPPSALPICIPFYPPSCDPVPHFRACTAEGGRDLLATVVYSDGGPQPKGMWDCSTPRLAAWMLAAACAALAPPPPLKHQIVERQGPLFYDRHSPLTGPRLERRHARNKGPCMHAHPVHRVAHVLPSLPATMLPPPPPCSLPPFLLSWASLYFFLPLPPPASLELSLPLLPLSPPLSPSPLQIPPFPDIYQCQTRLAGRLWQGLTANVHFGFPLPPTHPPTLPLCRHPHPPPLYRLHRSEHLCAILTPALMQASREVYNPSTFGCLLHERLMFD